MIAAQPAVVERDYTLIAPVWQTKLSVPLLKTLIANSKNGVYFIFDDRDRLMVYGDAVSNTWNVAYQKWNKPTDRYLFADEEKYPTMEKAFEAYIQRLTSKDPSKSLQKKAA